jgi:PAS domain S-box-containing protein
MADSDNSGKTMRIDIHPDFLGESLARMKKTTTGTSITDTTLLVRSKAIAAKPLAPEFEVLLQSIYDAVLITDPYGRILRYNSRSVDFFLANPETLFGEKVTTYISGADDALLEAVHKNLRDHRYTLIEAHCQRKDGSTFPTEIAVNRLELDYGGNLCFFVRDITVRKRAQEALEQAVERLEEHDRSRSQFVSNVSHELRTPLTSMIYAVNNMLKGVVGSLSPEVRRYLEMMDGDCRRLLGTVNDILDIRKLETKTLTLSKSDVPLARLVRRTMDSLRVQAEQKGIVMELVPDATKWFSQVDVNKMERVVMNVVGNAIKFTPDMGRIDVLVGADPEAPGHVLISVEDTGIGIPPEAIDKVSQRYFTVGEQATGSGLGLAISKEIVELHGGRLWIRSPPPNKDKGTGVYISLVAESPPIVMVVDDDEGVLSVMVKQIEGQGYRIISASNGLDAMEKIKTGRPDLMVLDFVMPEMDGTEVILKMKSDKTMMRIPIIVVTGAEVGRGRAQILNSFGIPALAKPWQETELLDRIEGAFLGASALHR